MSATKSIEYRTCSYCGEEVRQLIEIKGWRRIRAQTTTHVRHVRDLDIRCKYDEGPQVLSTAAEKFPGDT